MKEKKLTCSLNKLIIKRLIFTSKRELHKIKKKKKTWIYVEEILHRNILFSFMINSWACILKIYVYIIYINGY